MDGRIPMLAAVEGGGPAVKYTLGRFMGLGD
jgi:hypothetical protein